MAGEFTTDMAQTLLAEVFAPWVNQIGLKAEFLEADGGNFVVPDNAALALRGGPGEGVVCGQAVAAIADTVSVLTLAGANGRFRNCTTIDFSCNFLRPLMRGEIAVRTQVLANGRKTATVRVEIRQAGGGKLAATAHCAFLYLED